MLKKCLLLVLTLSFAAAAATAEDFYVPNPLIDSVLGDWVLYQTSDDGHQRQKMTVIKIEDEDDDDNLKITVQFDNFVQGKLVNSGKSVHTAKDFTNELSSDDKPGSTISIRAEEVMVKNKPIVCTVVTVTTDGDDASGAEEKPGDREWFLSDDIPIYGVVRQDANGETKSRLIDFGRGKGAREAVDLEEIIEE